MVAPSHLRSFQALELALRLGFALAALNFIVIAITVSSVSPRAGRSGNLVFALFAFVVYYNLLTLGQNWIAGGRFSFAGFMLALHGGALVAALLWLAKQHNGWTIRWRLRRHAQPAGDAAGGRSGA